ncbi:hypothetical protein IFM89_018269 [Coptis chinensis]|uniref:Uncharacterized protein n=1 Tax=Coptis chinensis TaxID=261450 RepID=A0A835LC47_9MAGN|nr:hypothetical protein IFM89_018269 [Coptis chinensis]
MAEGLTNCSTTLRQLHVDSNLLSGHLPDTIFDVIFGAAIYFFQQLFRTVEQETESTEKYGKCMFRSDINSCKITAAVLDVTSWSDVSKWVDPSPFEIKDWCKWASRAIFAVYSTATLEYLTT